MPLMPKEAADNTLTRARTLLSYSQEHELPEGAADDLVRTALVMGVAALDTYLHAAVLRTVRAWKPTASLAKLEIRFDEFCWLVEEAVDDRREDANSRPWVLIKDALQERLLKVTGGSTSSFIAGTGSSTRATSKGRRGRGKCGSRVSTRGA